jgi:hypothetical protein
MSSRILKPMPESRCANRSKAVNAHHEEAAHGIAELVLGAHQAQPPAQLAQLHPPACKLAHAAAGNVARAHHQIEILFAHAAQHLGQNAFVVLQVRVHHGYKGRRRGQNSLNARRGQSAPSDPVQHAQIVVLAQPAAAPRRRCRRASRRPQRSLRSECRRAPSPGDRQSAHVPALVERGQHDRQIVGHVFLRGG